MKVVVSKLALLVVRTHADTYIDNLVVTAYEAPRIRRTLSGRENKPKQTRKEAKGREAVYAGEKRENILSGKEAGLACRRSPRPLPAASDWMHFMQCDSVANSKSSHFPTVQSESDTWPKRSDAAN